MDDALRVAVQAPPVEGAANRAVIRLIARSFHTSPSRVRLVRGEKSKIKTLELVDLSDAKLAQQLTQLLNTTEAEGSKR